MKRVVNAIVVLGVGTWAVMGQQSSALNTSRSNTKNNIPVFSQDKDGKARCMVAGVPCTKAHLDQVNTALAAMNAAADEAAKGTSGKEPPKQASSYTTTKSNVKTSGLATDGSILCETTDGKTQPCTAAHVADLNKAARAVSTTGISGK